VVALRVCAVPSIVTCVTLLSLCPNPLQAQVRDERELIVRVYDTFGFAGQDMIAAQHTAAEILARSGVSLQWRTCRTTAGPSRAAPDTCATTLHHTEVMVRIVTGADESSGTVALGYSLMDVPTHSGTLSTVYGDRVRHLARDAGIKPTVLLGHAMAHELGHLLLGSREHAHEGLMRAHWLHTEMRRHSARDWQFTQSETAQMRVALLGRANADAVITARAASEISALPGVK
jgi:hypothetical protein